MMAHHIPIVTFIGRSNSGKTTLLEELIPVLHARGYRVGVVKHTSRADVETDIAGTDTRRLWDARAEHVAFAAADRVVHTHRQAFPPRLEETLSGVRDVDLIIVEGYKHSALPKVEVVRAARDPQLIADVVNRIACVTDVGDLSCDVPRFGFDDIAPLADFIERVIVKGA